MSQADVAAEPGVEFVSHYLKDLSFETPFGPCPPEKLDSVDLKRDLRVGVEVRGNGVHEVSLGLFATGTLEGRTILLCELTYVAMVRLHRIPEPVMPQVLSVTVPGLMLPQVKQILAGNSLFAGFPPLELDDVDFMAVFQASEASRPPGQPH